MKKWNEMKGWNLVPDLKPCRPHEKPEKSREIMERAGLCFIQKHLEGDAAGHWAGTRGKGNRKLTRALKGRDQWQGEESPGKTAEAGRTKGEGGERKRDSQGKD